MSEDDWETADWENEDPDCPYGFEFCEDPLTRDLGLCTTECNTYLDEVEETEKLREDIFQTKLRCERRERTP